jgi:hypothetical protein
MQGSKLEFLVFKIKFSEFTFVLEYNERGCIGLFSSTMVEAEP